MTRKKKHILAVGGGFGSVKLALELANDEHFEITLLTPHNVLEYHGALYRSATGRSPLEVALPFHEIFEKADNVTIVNDLMVELRAQAKIIKGQSGRTYGYDALVLGLGYEIEYFGIRGMREHAESIYTIYDTIKLRNKLRDTFVDNAGKASNIVLIGAGPTGVEVAGDLQTMADLVARQYRTKPTKPHVTLVDRADRVLPQLSPEASAAAADRLKDLGVKLKLKAAVGECKSTHLCINDDIEIKGDVIIWTAGSRANSFFERYPDIFSLDPRGRVAVNEFLQANSADIYVLGDAASTKYSGMAQTAINDAHQLAANFKRYVRKEDIKPYKPHPPVYVVPIGREWAVAEQGKELVVGKDAWAIRREADYFVLHSFLPKRLAQEHWRKAYEIAQL